MTGSMVRESRGFWSSIRQLYAVAQVGRAREIWILVFLTACGALSEVITIGAVVPFLALLSSSGAHHAPWVDTAFARFGVRTRGDLLIITTAALCVAALAAGLFRILLTRRTQDFAFTFGHRVAVEIQRRALFQPFTWHVGHNSSEQLAMLEKVEIVADLVLLPLIQALAAAILIAVVLALLLQIAPVATLAAGLSLGAAYWVLGAFARHRLEANSKRIDKALEQRIRVIQEGLGAIRDVILGSAQLKVLDRFRSIDSGLTRTRANSAFVSAVPRYVVESAGIIVIVALSVVLAGRDGGLIAAIPVLGALALGAQRLLPLVQQLYSGWTSVIGNRFVIDDVVRRLQLVASPAPPPGPRLPFAKEVTFRGVTFAYQGTAEVAVKELTFAIPHGSRTALSGPTGSGKSTTADLLMALLEPTEGKILVDGCAIGAANRAAWQANIAHVPQLIFLADGSITENIALATDVDEQRVREAASLAHLDEFVGSLPDGYDTRVGERGSRISGGQRQRLALARAIYKNAPLLVLDEATSALDDETESAIANSLDALQNEGRTIVIIAHRSRLISTCDQVVFLQKGHINRIEARADQSRL